MITLINSANTGKYSYLFSEVSQLLRTHDVNGNEVAMGSDQAILTLDKVTLTQDTYEAARYYVKNASSEYVISNDDFVEGQDYYKSDDITSLDEFFCYIQEIAAIEPRYTRLPLDEDVFEINTNTRAISVPSSFAKNGISVQGDEISEIVYFKVNRYYDATDLYGNPNGGDDQMKIFIQWKTPSGKEGVSRPWVVDKESEPGYIIFGWPLSSKITESSGNVQFSVRFYKYDSDTKVIKYSLSTLTQTAAIKPALDFDLLDIFADGTDIDDRSNFITERFTDSVSSGSAVSAATPVFLLNLPYTRNMDEEDGFLSKAVTLTVQAVSTDAGSISYVLHKRPLNADGTIGDGLTTTSNPDDIQAAKIEMVPTADTKPDSKKTYYIKSTTGEFILLNTDTYASGFSTDDSGNMTTGTGSDAKIIYEKVCTIIINSVGYYYVQAVNRVRNTRATLNTPPEQTEGIIAYCIVPRPVAPEIETGLDLAANKQLVQADAYKLTLTDYATTSDAGTLTYEWQYSATGAEDSFAAITKTVAKTNEDGEYIDAAGDVVENAEDAVQVSVAETAKTLVIEGKYTEISETDADGNVTVTVGDAQLNADGFADGDGYYRVITTNNLNRELPSDGGAICQESLTSAVCRVTHAPTKPVITTVYPEDESLSLAELSDGKAFEITASLTAGSGEDKMWDDEKDSFTYQWYKFHSAQNNQAQNDIDEAAFRNGTYVRKETDTALDVATYAGATSNKLTPLSTDIGSRFFCEVTKTYNGQTAVRCSRAYAFLE